MLLDWIKWQIESNGPVTMARFMEWALYHPDWGYYTRGPQIGPRGDFTTSPEASPAFGIMLARHIVEVDALLGRPDPLDILECGPGQGTLARDLLDTIWEEAPEVYNRAKYIFLEVSPALRQIQGALFNTRHRERVEWISHLSILERPIRGAILGNEFLDAFPVHLLRQYEGTLVEVFVGLDQNGELTAIYAPPSSSALIDFLTRYGLKLEEGESIEVSLDAAAWIASLAAIVDRGVAAFFDYGDTQPKRFSPARREGTLLGYRGGAVASDPLAYPGEQDLTALVDFTHMSDSALDAGFDLLGITRQATFLVGLGLGEGRTSTLAHTEVESALNYRKGLQSLISMEGLGRFHVLLLSKGIDPLRAQSELSGLKYSGIL
jgi:SAM-dependent MidA family methyltransferase